MLGKVIQPEFETMHSIEPTAIVLHWWQMPSWLVGIKYFVGRLKMRNVSVQFAILKDGTIYQLVDDPATFCRHARCANRSSIGIEVQGWGKRQLDKQRLQFEAVVKLVRELSKTYSIQSDFKVEQEPEGLRFFGITSHKVVDTYCNQHRFLRKRDVHDEYLKRVINRLNEA